MAKDTHEGFTHYGTSAAFVSPNHVHQMRDLIHARHGIRQKATFFEVDLAS
jgi:hypothetical protein